MTSREPEVTSAPPCRICGAASLGVGEAISAYSGRRYRLRRCRSCHFAFVANPWLDLGAIYGEAYYRGQGADPLVDYLAETEHPETTVRIHEWRGTRARVASLVPLGAETSWLDFGCGAGGLVRFLRGTGVPGAVGYEPGWAAAWLRDRSIPVLSDRDLDQSTGRFDVVTAIEVIEHVLDPVGLLTRIRAVMRPGGLLFLTTGNAAPYRDRLTSWRYVTPDVHISFFEPETLGRALRAAGFEPGFPGFGPGWADIIRYKTLKSLRRQRRTRIQALVPWSVVAPLIDRRLRLSAQPVGWAR
jgi:SAM-dependent methyltransferase